MAGNITGQTLNNRYLVGERIGVGGMAEVYQGQDTVLGRIVAIKVMLPQYAEDPAFTARFRQEAAAAANLQSPYIVNVYDWGQENATSFIVMEYVRGSDLKTAINERGAVNQRKVAEIGSQVAQALSVAHGLDIIHRDIKPQNIMIQPDGNVKVMDFGIARAKNSMMDKTDAVLGTAHYISPEQAQGKDLSPASDIYSLGVVLYEAVTGQLPFDGPDAVSVAMKQVHDQPIPPSQLVSGLSPDLEAIILKAMSKNPANRFATAADMRKALNDYLNGRPVTGMAGMGGATQLIDAPATQTINPVNTAYNLDKTGVMSPAEVNAMNAGANMQHHYKSPDVDAETKKSRGPIIAVAALLVVAIVAGLGFLLLGNSCSAPGAEVPNVEGKTLEDATQMIEAAGLTLGKVTNSFDEKAEENTVIKQSPRAGSSQEKGTAVDLTVSQGKEQVTVPDLRNMTANEARSALQKLGLKFEAGQPEASDDIAENRIVSQKPDAGEKVAKGSTVMYTLSSGKEKKEIPNVVGEGEGSASAAITNAGFQIAIDYKSSTEVPEGEVISQSPKGGEKAAKDSTVSIIVSSGAKQFTATSHTSGAAGGGTVTPETMQVPEGGSVTFYITTNPGYKVASITDNAGNTYGASSSVTISNIRSNVSIAVAFEAVASSSKPAATS